MLGKASNPPRDFKLGKLSRTPSMKPLAFLSGSAFFFCFVPNCRYSIKNEQKFPNRTRHAALEVEGRKAAGESRGEACGVFRVPVGGGRSAERSRGRWALRALSQLLASWAFVGRIPQWSEQLLGR